MNWYFVLIFFLPLQLAFAEDAPFDYAEEKSAGENRIMKYDLSKIDFQIISVHKIFIPKWIDEPGDYSDILKIKFNVTNPELENFNIYKNMFQIDVVDTKQFTDKKPHHSDFLIDNYYPQYVEDFKLRFQDLTLHASLDECILLNNSVAITETATLSVCFDVKQKWSNRPLDLNGPLLYYLVMMDNKFSSSCPNCIVKLLNDFYQNPIIESKIPPRLQLSLGIPIEKIFCKDNLELIFKNPAKPACVTPKTADILENRGWMRLLE